MFRPNMGTKEEIFNIRTICERFLNVNQDIYSKGETLINDRMLI